MARALFSNRIHLRFRHADPAGILFFGNVYKIAHDTYEDFIQYLGFDWKEWFHNPEWAVPIRHSSCEHLAPLEPARSYEVEVWVDRISKSSFTVKYVFVAEGVTFCEVSLVHTFINKRTRTKMSIPSEVVDRLEAYRRECLEAE